MSTRFHCRNPGLTVDIAFLGPPLPSMRRSFFPQPHFEENSEGNTEGPGFPVKVTKQTRHSLLQFWVWLVATPIKAWECRIVSYCGWKSEIHLAPAKKPWATDSHLHANHANHQRFLNAATWISSRAIQKGSRKNLGRLHSLSLGTET